MNLPPCDVCGKPTAPEKAALSIDDYQAAKRLDAIRVGEQEHLPLKDARGLERIETPEMRRRVPGLLPWRFGHRLCVQDRGYCIDFLRFDSAGKVVAWTQHLWWKPWFRATDWWAAVERIHGHFDA